ncbi:DUF4136 domain-containing protein [Tenacibaculum sp.]|nr:DUF4136 domain-containing protein [Tenacibaculum sp.]
MKLLKPLLIVILITLTSCSTVKVATDYDTKVDFNQYKTFAFYKKGIDKAPISDLDKKRIMRAIEAELLANGMTKSSTPDILVSLFTKSRERVNINDNRFNGFYYPWYYGPSPVTVSQYTEGTLFIDLIDGKTKELVWQGIGTGALRMSNVEKKEARIKEFVAEIMAKYPPGSKKK